MVLAYAGSDNPGTTEAERAKACSEACLRRQTYYGTPWGNVDLQTFFVQPPVGRCWCQSLPSSCSNTMSLVTGDYDTYDWIGDKSCCLINSGLQGFADATGNYPLTTTGITFESSGYFNQAMKMDSDSDEVKTTSNLFGANGITDATPVTFSMWVKRTRTGVNRDFIFSIGAAGTDTQLGASFMPADTLEFYIYAGNTITTTTTFTDNIWYFLTFTRSITKEMRVYSNAQLQGSKTNDNALAAVGSLYIGQMSSGIYFNDRSRNIIDDFRVYNRVLTDAEITALYQAGTVNAITGTPTAYATPQVILRYNTTVCPTTDTTDSTDTTPEPTPEATTCCFKTWPN